MFWYHYRVRHPSEVTVECLGKGNMNENNENYELKREIRPLIPLNESYPFIFFLETTSRSPFSGYPLPVFPPIRVGRSDHPSPCWHCLAWVYTSLVHAFTFSVHAYVQLSWCVLETGFPFCHSPPLVFASSYTLTPESGEVGVIQMSCQGLVILQSSVLWTWTSCGSLC